MTVSYAVHRLSGLVTPANAAYSARELELQLRDSGAKAVFTCIPLLGTCLEAAKAVGISNKHIYILEMPREFSGDKAVSFATVDQLIDKGRKLQDLEPLKWEIGQGSRQTAFLCYSSGTSGLPVRTCALFIRPVNDKWTIERRNDLPQKYHCKYYANRDLRSR